ncbi:hypothetical protein EPO15_10935 [bacterium]|nr:MAG: hypothetical protein EPO15_10935 [bacterium]
MSEPKPQGGLGLGTFLAAGVMIAGAFFGLKWWEAKQKPPPEPSFEPAASAAALAKPDALPGTPRREDPPAEPTDSLGMVKPAEDYAGFATGGPMVNSRPEPPLIYTGDKGTERPQTRVIKAKKDWDALWKETGGHDMPFVDFEKYMGLVVFAGERPAGTKVAVVAGKPEGSRFEVRWKVQAPKAPEAGTARPFAAILVPRTTATPVFREAKSDGRSRP